MDKSQIAVDTEMDTDRIKLFNHGEGILTIDQPEVLFSSPAEVKNEYRELARIWHPDRCRAAGAERVFAHINSLYDKALEKITKGTWISFHFVKRFKFELGEAFISYDRVTFIVEAKHKAYVENFRKTLGKFKYGSSRMQTEVERYLPTRASFTKEGDSYVVEVPKAADLIRLRDVLDFYKGSLDTKHAAWIGSSLYNLVCYLDFTGVVHGDISLDTYFISPEQHSGALLGGWWYATSVDSRLSSLPRRTFDLLPASVLKTRRAHSSIDLELVRAVGRELTRTNLDKAPAPLQMWLKSVTTAGPIEEYKNWQNVLKDSFGSRRFIKMNLTPEEVYT